jgi:ATP synthase protein I
MEARIEAQEKTQRFFRAAQFASLGLEMGIAVVIGWWVGSWLDRKLDTGPWLMLVFLLFGVAAGFKGLWRASQALREPAPSPNSDRDPD